MIEYLYIDTRRLDNYFEQISSPVIYDKVPTWNVEVSLIGPKAAGTQTRLGRAPTTHEKIQQFVDYIHSKKLTTKERPSFLNYPHSEKLAELFITETLTARRVQITRSDDFLNIWVSMRPSKERIVYDTPIGALYLIEDFHGNESGHNTFSGYSSLYLLAAELEWVTNPEIISGPIETLRKQDDATRLFALDPVGTLKSLGGKIGPERRITTVYRYRSSCIEMEGQDSGVITTIGYPIFVQEGA